MTKFLDYDETKDKCVSCRIELSHCKLIFDKKPTGERMREMLFHNVVGIGCCDPRLN